MSLISYIKENYSNKIEFLNKINYLLVNNDIVKTFVILNIS